MAQPDRIGDYLQRLTPLTRSNLLAELERLQVCDVEIPGAATVLEKLRAEFRKSGQADNIGINASRYFFEPLEPLLVDGSPEHTNHGGVSRGSLPAIWQWISRDLLPTMAGDYVKSMNELIDAGKQKEARKLAGAFQTKVFRYLESTLGSPEGAQLTRTKLATYTMSQSAYGDLAKMLRVLRTHGALAKFNEALPARIDKFDEALLPKVLQLLDRLGKTDAEAIPFALTLIARRLTVSWRLIGLATKTAPGKNAAVIAAMPYAIVIDMVLDQIDNRRFQLRTALKNGRILVAKGILTEIYDTEYALRVRIDGLDESEWGQRLNLLMNAIAVLVQTEVGRFPDKLGHVLESRSLRSYQSLAGRLTYLAWKGRDALAGGTAYCKKLVGQAEKQGAQR